MKAGSETASTCEVDWQSRVYNMVAVQMSGGKLLATRNCSRACARESVKAGRIGALCLTNPRIAAGHE